MAICAVLSDTNNKRKGNGGSMTTAQLASGVQAIAAIGSAIQELGSEYDRIISILIRAGLVSRDVSHMLQWTGPAKIEEK